LLSKKNKVARNFIGAGFRLHHAAVIQRNISKSRLVHGFTPYQAEIAQGRLEALLVFQQMIMDLTALDMPTRIAR